MRVRRMLVGAALAMASLGVATGAADAKGGANNDDGPYGPGCLESDTCVESANGNGKGKATGRPDAGTVGRADGKNPPGQLPDGSDRNNGYECDGNSGVRKGNPAHSACTPPPPPED